MRYTIVSLYPEEIVERVHTYNPPDFVIPAGPSVYHVPENVSYSEYINEGKSRRIPVDAKELAHELVRSFTTSIEEFTPITMPALAVIEDEKYLSYEEVSKKHFKLITEINGKQLEWFQALIRKADDSWQVKRQHRFITRTQKLAAKALKLTREWAEVKKAEDMLSCPACGNLVSKSVAICGNCNCITNEALVRDLKFLGAGLQKVG